MTSFMINTVIFTMRLVTLRSSINVNPVLI